VESYLSGKIGTPLLTLQDIFATPGPKLIVGLPPELLRNPSVNQQSPLSAIVDYWVEALGERLELIERLGTVESEREGIFEEYPQQQIEHGQTEYVTHIERSYEDQQSDISEIEEEQVRYVVHEEQCHEEQHQAIEQERAKYEAEQQEKRRRQELERLEQEARQQTRYLQM
jgi:hypothetical protein